MGENIPKIWTITTTMTMMAVAVTMRKATLESPTKVPMIMITMRCLTAMAAVVTTSMAQVAVMTMITSGFRFR